MNENNLSKDKLDTLFDEIVECGRYARKIQKNITRNYKEDGSVLTKADIEISNRIIKKINTLFSNCNVISEESITPYNNEAPFTFILDPIDGTDIYSQGLSMFVIALGILDKNKKPVGSMIIAPRFGIGQEELTIRLDPYQTLLVDNQPYKLQYEKDIPTQLTVSSKIQKTLNFDNFNGKVRTFGSSILHILAPAIFSNIEGCINQKAYAWDISASHAVLEYLNLKVLYKDKTPLIYDDDLLINRKVCKDIIYCGTQKCIENMMQAIS